MNLTTEEIALLRQVFTWTRANGIRWTDVRDGECARCRVWKSADGRREVHAWDRLESDDDLGIFVKRDNVSQGLELRDVREIVDVLCALDVLPHRFSSAYWRGVAFAAVSVAVDAGAARADAVAGRAAAEREAVA